MNSNSPILCIFIHETLRRSGLPLISNAIDQRIFVCLSFPSNDNDINRTRARRRGRVGRAAARGTKKRHGRGSAIQNTRARACANPRLITSLTLFAGRAVSLAGVSILFPQSARRRTARLVLITFFVAPLPSPVRVRARARERLASHRSFHFTRFRGKPPKPGRRNPRTEPPGAAPSRTV